MKAAQKTAVVLAKLHRNGLTNATTEHAHTLRRAELTLQKWYELECGTNNQYSSFMIERDENTNVPFMRIIPNQGKERRYKVADRERGAIARVAKICAEINAHYYIQTDPRGCSVYVSSEPIDDRIYTRGVACCE